MVEESFHKHGLFRYTSEFLPRHQTYYKIPVPAAKSTFSVLQFA